MPDEPVPFDLCGPLPGPGVTLLEASAGTGKTFTIAALTARFVAEGTPIDDILAVTFTRMATAELRDRVRARLASAESQLGLFVDAGGPLPSSDGVVHLLAQGAAEEVGARRRRLSDALAVFDAATITTTHGFCQLMLAGLGVAGSVGIRPELIEDANDVVDEAVDDLYLRRVLGWGVPAFPRRVARQIAREAVANQTTSLQPDPGDSVPGRQRRLAEAARQEVAKRLLDRNLLTFDDLLVRLRAALADDRRGRDARRLLRSRYRVVLIDEFQDTDPVQWDVVRLAFGDGRTTLVLIGDPKQAIYSFRGADVYAYLDAARLATRRYTLSDNWRSDEGLLAAYDALLAPVHLGHPDIPYRRVAATAAHRRPGLIGAPMAQALRIRMLRTADGLVRLTSKGAQKDAARDWIAGDLANDVVRLLTAEATLAEPQSGSNGESRRVLPGDIAVLVRTNQQAAAVQAALRDVRIPAVMGGTESVFTSTSARHWLRLLEALEQPSSRSRAVAVALTPLIGMSPAQVAGADETTWELLHARLHQWAEVLRRFGVAALARTVLAAEAVPARVLRQPSGERQLTDFGHVAQLLHAEAASSQLGAPALRAWMARRIDESDSETTDAEDRSRRLDSDADAVQVLTIHRAKGLEFPVVYCPFLWDAGPVPRIGQPVVFHDQDHGHRRTLDVGVSEPGPAYRAHLQAAHDEQRGEDLRLLYVALSRARHQAVIWWVRAYESEHSPLGRVLMFRDADGHVPSSAKYAPRDADVGRRLQQLATQLPTHISVEYCDAYTSISWVGAPPPPPRLLTASFGRQLDLSWRRTSYTAITSVDRGDAVSSEPEQPGTTDEPATAGGANADRGSATADEGRLRARPCLLGGTPGGAEVGTFVHQVLERVDFSAPDLTAAVSSAIMAEQARRSVSIGSPDALMAGLVAALSTPLGPLAEGRCLRDVPRGDRVDELHFELPIAGGDDPTGEVLMGDLARLFNSHTDAYGALAGYGIRLASPELASHLRGYLSGSIDAVLRLTAKEGPTRFLVIDYKTNWLAPAGELLTAWHYRPEALDAEMQLAHYPLQALLYLVALHRYLRWRLPDYDPVKNLGGVLYTFLRGMLGPDSPHASGRPCGVFGWRPPVGLVIGLSDLIDRGLDKR
jgi:exodeoxyribonuclease V beta subunit